MLSQIEVLAPRPRIATIAEAVHVAIDVFPNPPQVTFFVTTPDLGVTVDPTDASILIVHPGDYFLDFTVVGDTLKNPALLVKTPFGVMSVPPTGSSTVTLSDHNPLHLGEGEQIFEFTFNFASGPLDPTIVNTPDPA